jgi:hypothetical protein
MLRLGNGTDKTDLSPSFRTCVRGSLVLSVRLFPIYRNMRDDEIYRNR